MPPNPKQSTPTTSQDLQQPALAPGAGSLVARPRPKTSEELDQGPPAGPLVNWNNIRPQRARADGVRPQHLEGQGSYAYGSDNDSVGNTADDPGTAWIDGQALGLGEPVSWSQVVHVVPLGPKYDLVDLEVSPFPTAMPSYAQTVDGWRAYSQGLLALDAQQRAIASEYDDYRNPARSDELRLLGFTLPEDGGDGGDMASLANTQTVVPGQTIGALFTSDNQLAASQNDRRAIATAEHAFQAHNAAKSAHDEIGQADQGLSAAYDFFRAASQRVLAAGRAVDAAQAAIEAREAGRQVDRDKDNLEKAKKQKEGAQKTLEFMFGGALKYLVAAEPLDALEAVGTMASYAVGMVSDHAIDDAERKLATDTAALETAQNDQDTATLDQAKATLTAAFSNLRGTRHKLLEEMGKRQKTFAAAGAASAQASGGDAASRAKIAGAIAAIPTVEYVLQRAKSIEERAQPRVYVGGAFDVGYRMALAAGDPSARAFVAAYSELSSVRMKMAADSQRWGQRLTQLKNLQQRLGGRRPGGDAPPMDDIGAR